MLRLKGIFFLMKKGCLLYSLGKSNKEFVYEAAFIDFTDPALDRSTSLLALQRRLGIWSKRDYRIDSDYSTRTRFSGADLAAFRAWGSECLRNRIVFERSELPLHSRVDPHLAVFPHQPVASEEKTLKKTVA